MWTLGYWIAVPVLVAAGLFLWDRIAGIVFRRLAPWLQNEICGPDGWLVDTKHRKGVFDVRSRWGT